MKEELSSPATGGPGHVPLWLAFANGMIANVKHIPRLKTRLWSGLPMCASKIHQELKGNMLVQENEQTHGVNVNPSGHTEPNPAGSLHIQSPPVSKSWLVAVISHWEMWLVG